MVDRPPICVDRLEALANRLAQDVALGLIPGATIMVGRRDGIAFERSVGFRDAAAGEPLRSDAIWRIYSMTKPLVTAAAMILLEAGLLRLDQDVAELIPAFASLRVAQADGGTVPAEARATVQDLMRHTAGLAYGYLAGGPAQRALAADGFLTEDLPLRHFVDRLTALPLAYQPGTVWHYSHATEVLGRVLEMISGQNLQDMLRDALFRPLGMADTGYLLPAEQRGRVAEPLPRQPGRRPRFFDPCVPRRHQSAGGGLVSTAADYARFLRMLLGRGRLDGCRVLSPAAVRLMTCDHLGHCIRRAAYYPPGPGYGFGLGFAVRLSDGEPPYPGSRGDFFWSGVGGTYFWVDPAQDLFVIFMLQSSSMEQRAHYRTVMRNLVYAALG